MSSVVFLFLKLCFEFLYSATGYGLVIAVYSCVLSGLALDRKRGWG